MKGTVRVFLTGLDAGELSTVTLDIKKIKTIPIFQVYYLKKADRQTERYTDRRTDTERQTEGHQGGKTDS